MASNDGSLKDSSDDSPDWIELFNPSSTPVDLEGYRLTDEADNPSKWAFPSRILDPGEYLVVFASGRDVHDHVDTDSNLHTNFKLKAGGEYLGLVAPDGQTVSEFGPEFPEQRGNISYGVAQTTLNFVDGNSDAEFWIPDHGSLDDVWTDAGFDAASNGFSVGKAAVGYDNGAPESPGAFTGEILSAILPAHAVYLRVPFMVPDASALQKLTLRLKYDNGFIAYLNGVRIADDNAPMDPNSMSTAPRRGQSDRDALKYVEIDLKDDAAYLVDGENLLAIHGLNHLPDDSDMLLVPQLVGIVPSPDLQVGYLSPATPGQPNADVVYSGFASRVQMSAERGFFDAPQRVEISGESEGASIYYTTDGSDPSPSNSGTLLYTGALTIGETTTLRAAAFKPGLIPSKIDTHTYLFVDDVIRQKVMKTRITQDEEWGPRLRDSLLAIPSISLSVPDFGQSQVMPETGSSVEMIYPDGTKGFQIDAGTERFGGASLTWAKPSIRMSFKGIYGAKQLVYDVFGDGATNEFDQLLLRSGSADQFGRLIWSPVRGMAIRNKWANDRQQEMGQPAPQGRFVHLYINGGYWGMYHLMERPNAAFMVSRFGGDKSDYDVLNSGAPVDGDSAAWVDTRRALKDYDQIQRFVDLENYVDYMLLQFYSANEDWGPSHNWMAARKREEGAGWIFFSWDSDAILQSADADVIHLRGPGFLLNGLEQHEEFRILLADRVQKHFFDGGVFTTERALVRLDELADSVRLPIIAETARWAPSGSQSPASLETSLERVREIMRSRTDVVVEQLRQAGLFPAMDAPAYLVDGRPHQGGVVGTRRQLEMTASQGTIYFTLDGSDPRVVGGGVSQEALLYNGPVHLERTVTVKSRVLHEGQWSALRETNFQPTMIGDANLDGVFDSSDLLQVLRAGKYLTGQPATWAEGDWNEDGFFGSEDLVAALQVSQYIASAALSQSADASEVDVSRASLDGPDSMAPLSASRHESLQSAVKRREIAAAVDLALKWMPLDDDGKLIL